jgi:predicted aminopeptidase
MIQFPLPWKWIAIGGAILGSLVLMSGLYAYGAHQLRSTINEAREEAKEARDQFWRAAIAESNATAEAARAASANARAQAEATARAEIDRLRTQLTELETANAALPGGDACGIDADRLRLLR